MKWIFLIIASTFGASGERIRVNPHGVTGDDLRLALGCTPPKNPPFGGCRYDTLYIWDKDGKERRFSLEKITEAAIKELKFAEVEK